MSRKIRPGKLELVFAAAGGLLLLFAFISLWQWYQQTAGVHPPPDPNVVIADTELSPSEKPVNKHSAYNVPGDEPKLITIPAITAEGYIQKINDDKKTGQMAVPTNINFAGWYVSAAKPGESGLSIINGHVSGRYKPAIFKNLAQLTPGDVVTITYGDDSKKNFEVLSKREVPAEQAGDYLFLKNPSINSQLNLITCGGTFNKKARQYNDRVIIETKLID